MGRFSCVCMGKLAKQPPGRPSRASLQQAQLALNERQLQFAVWLSTPERYRKPATQKEFAAELGVSEVTLWRWAKDPQVQMATKWLILQNAGDPSRISQILDFLHGTALDREQHMKDRLAAARDWLQAVGVKDAYRQDNRLLKVQTVDDIDLSELDDEQLYELYEQRASQLSSGDSGVPQVPETASDGSQPLPGASGEDSDVIDGEIVGD